MKKKIFSTLTGSAILVASVLPTFLISCSKSKSDIETIELLDGETDILIDQSSSENVTGRTFKPWNLYINGSICESKTVTWELIDCDDDNIWIEDGFVYWNKPKPKTTTFSIKASFFDQQSEKVFSCTSQIITLHADPSAIKVEFFNSDPLANVISAFAYKKGCQSTPWQIKLNDTLYTGSYAPFVLLDDDGVDFKDFSFDDNRQIVWTDQISPVSQKRLYISTTIVDTKTSKSYNIYSTNNPIIVDVKQPLLTINGDKNEYYVKARHEGDVATWQALNSENIDISSLNTTDWTLENTGEKEFGNKIYIDKGVLKFKSDLPIGKYSFNINVSDALQSTSTKTTTPIELTCYEPMDIRGGSEIIMAQINTEGSWEETWSLYSGSTLLQGAEFSIVPVDQSEESKIEEFKKHVTLNPVSSGTAVSLHWDNSFSTAEEIRFKIQAIYNGTKVLSSVITFNITDPSVLSLKITGPDQVYAFRSSKDIVRATSSSNGLLDESQHANDDHKPEEELSTPFKIYLSNGHKLQWKAVEYDVQASFGSANDNKVHFNIDDNGVLSWYGLEAYDELLSKEVDVRINVKYTPEQGKPAITDVKHLKFNIINLNDSGRVNLLGNGWYFDSSSINETQIETSRIYAPTSSNKQKFTNGYSWAFHKRPYFDSQKNKKDYCSICFYDKSQKDKGYNHYCYETVAINIPVAPRTKFQANLCFTGPNKNAGIGDKGTPATWYHKISKHCTTKQSDLFNCGGILNYGQNKYEPEWIPNLVCDPHPGGDWDKRAIFVSELKKHHQVQRNYVSYGPRESLSTQEGTDNVKWSPTDISWNRIPEEDKNRPIPITLINDTDYEQTMQWYIGVWAGISNHSRSGCWFEYVLPLSLQDISIDVAA